MTRVTHRTRMGTALAVFACALAVRWLFCFVAIPSLHLNVGPGRADFLSSSDGYADLAVNLAEHGRFAFTPTGPLTTYRAPGYPFVLALGYWITQDIGVTVMLVNCLASAATCLIIFGIAIHLLDDRATFRLMWPVILFPLSIYYCASAFSDTFVAMTFAGCLYFTLALFRAPSIKRGLLSGAMFAGAALTKAVVLPLPIVIAGYAVGRRRAAAPGMVASIVFGGALVAGWTIRNYQVASEFIPVTGGAGFNMLIGSYMIDSGRDCDSSLKHGRDQALAAVHAFGAEDVRLEMLDPGNGHLDVPPRIDRIYGRVAMAQYLADPMLLLRKLAVNAARFWYFSSSPMKSLVNGIINFFVLGLAIVGLLMAWRNRPVDVELIVLVCAALVVLYSIVIVHSSRFGLPVVMVLLPAAGHAVAGMFARRESSAVARRHAAYAGV